MEMLIKKGAGWKERDDWGWNVLHEAAAADHPGTIQWICRESKGLINMSDRLGRTPLLAALMAGARLESVRELLDQGEDPGQEDEVGRGAPEAAVLYCDTEVEKFNKNLYVEHCVKVIQHVLRRCKAQDGDKKVDLNRSLLMEIAEDHAENEKVQEIIVSVTS